MQIAPTALHALTRNESAYAHAFFTPEGQCARDSTVVFGVSDAGDLCGCRQVFDHRQAVPTRSPNAPRCSQALSPRYPAALLLLLPWISRCCRLVSLPALSAAGLSHLPWEDAYDSTMVAYASHQLNVFKPRPKVEVRKNLMAAHTSGTDADTSTDTGTDTGTETSTNEAAAIVSLWPSELSLRLVHDFVLLAPGIPR